MKAVLMSIQPKWCELIANGKKTVEVRKTRPKIDTPFKVYVYCTKKFSRSGDGYFQGKYFGKVIGEFVCNYIGTVGWTSNPSKLDWRKGVYNEETCLTNEETYEYTKGEKFYEWNISNLIIYDKPKELSEFFAYCDRCDKRPIACKFAYEESNENGYYSECMCDFKRPIERPPQSWCYVEERRENDV